MVAKCIAVSPLKSVFQTQHQTFYNILFYLLFQHQYISGKRYKKLKILIEPISNI